MADDVAGSSIPHSSHWGAFSVAVGDGGVRVLPHPGDPDPSPLLGNIPAALGHRARIAAPMIRRGWLERGPGADRNRGRQDFVQLSVDGGARPRRGRTSSCLCRAWRPVGVRWLIWMGQCRAFPPCAGPTAPLPQCPRRLRQVSQLLQLRRRVGDSATRSRPDGIRWAGECQLARTGDTTEVVLAFGGLPLKNTNVSGGGTSQHVARDHLLAAHRRGASFHLISPLRDDLPSAIDAHWHPIRPGTDVALMLGIAHTLMSEQLHDTEFLDRFCVGYKEFEQYLSGRSDGQPKDAAWAAAICELPAETIRALAREAAGRRTWSPVPSRCSGPNMANSRSGWASCWRRCWARSACRAAVLSMRWAPSPMSANRLWRCRCRRLPQGHEPRPGPDPGRPHRRHVAATRQDYDFNGRRLTYPGHQVGLLGRRQPVPPSSGHQSAARGVRAARHRDRA